MQYLDAISKTTEWSLFVSKANHSISGNPSLCPDQSCWSSWSWMVLWIPYNALELTPQKDVLFIIGDWNAKVGSQETPGVTGKFGLGVQNWSRAKANRVLPRAELVIANTNFQQHKRDSAHGHHQMVNTKIRLIIIFAAKDGEGLYSQQKQDWELAQIMNSLLPNSDLNWRKWGKPLDHSGMT